ncbi:hypothetical protein F5B21DRAFT_267345 [Xylaria acuta]|nr:hypothetical protein F5B21DRAFT_267345 [Xylaria acuta]
MGKSHIALLRNCFIHPFPLSVLHRILDRLPCPLRIVSYRYCLQSSSLPIAPQLLKQPDLTRQASRTQLCVVPFLSRMSPCLPTSISHPEAISVHVHASLHIPPALTYTGPVVNPALPGRQPSTGWLPTNPPLPLAACLGNAKSIACFLTCYYFGLPFIAYAFLAFAVVAAPTSPPYYPLPPLPNQHLSLYFPQCSAQSRRLSYTYW